MAKTGEVSSLDDAVGAIPNPVFSHRSFPFILFDGSFPGLDELYHSHALIHTLLNADHQCSPRLSFSAPCFPSGHQGLCSHQTPDSMSSSQGVCWALPLSLLPALWPGISLEAVPQVVFLGLSCMSLISWASWKPLFYVPSPPTIFSGFKWESKSNYSILIRSRSHKCSSHSCGASFSLPSALT